ncbi:MAG: LEPR-XLL domain-containing protein, partial [Xanthobacteraceae bacterium]
MKASLLKAAGASKSAKSFLDCAELARTPRPFSRLVDHLCETTSVGRFAQRQRDKPPSRTPHDKRPPTAEGCGNRLSSKPKRQWTQLLFEPLEPRLLLSADVIAVDLSNGADAQQNHSLLIRQIEETEIVGDQTVSVQRVQVVDQNSGTVLAFGNRSQIGAIVINTGSGSDSLTIQLDSPNDVLPTIAFDGGAGEDRIVIEASSLGSQPFTWTIDGDNSGTLTGPLSIDFSNVENLAGSDDTEDTFVITADGHLDGILDGGLRGFDTLVLDGGSFSRVSYAATGPDYGTIDRDGQVIAYAGLEPIVDNSIV